MSKALLNTEGKLLTDNKPNSESSDKQEELGILQVLDQLEQVSDALLNRFFIPCTLIIICL